AARSDVDPKVFRLGAELDHDVDPALLQDALEETFERFPLYHAVLRRGVFWYYLQDSDLRPEASAETEQVCAPLYQPDRRTLLFRVVHHRRRGSLEVVHALSDGPGALLFLPDLPGAAARPGPRTRRCRGGPHRRRVSLEVSPAPSDGTGALWFLTALLGAYTRRRFPAEAPPGEAADLQVRPGASERPDPPPAEVGSRPG